jgi:hypothetical protein
LEVNRTEQRRIDEIHEVTGFTKTVLETGNMVNRHADEVMSWAAHREVSRDEDTAYSLMGPFDIKMPMLYGEDGIKVCKSLARSDLQTLGGRHAVSLDIYIPSLDLPAMLADNPHQSCRKIGPYKDCNQHPGLICISKDILY